MPRISPEKTSFAQTCNLVSHYLKEKGTLRDLNLGINGEADSTFSAKTKINNIKPMNLFSQHASMQLDDDDAISIITSSTFNEQAESQAKNGQMTIFYGGQVMVLDDICHGKAKQVMMHLASKSGFVIPPSSSKYHAHYSMCSAASRGNDDIKQHQQQQWQPIASDLPIARRASLHRFLSKRKDRASARGPYHLHNNNNNNKYPSPKEHFDLNL